MKFKIATMTFHWATNYGAVLQSYALQKFLKDNGYETEIINYIPWVFRCVQVAKWIKEKQLYNFSKEKKLERFRKKYLLRTKKYIRSKNLRKCANYYSVIICGSDQIWNESFTFHGELKPTLAYFCDFASDNTKRIAYATSFGADQVSATYTNLVMPELKKYASISVRERSGAEIVKELGLNVTQVCDPTLLLTTKDYLTIAEECKVDNMSGVFSYILHGHDEAKKISNYVKNYYGCDCSFSGIDDGNYGMSEWLKRIRSADIVVTNSFHGVVLSLILNRPFIAVLINGSGMNDRLITILSEVGLENRILYDFDENRIKAICTSTIDWDIVNEKLDTLRNKGRQFLRDAIIECE